MVVTRALPTHLPAPFSLSSSSIPVGSFSVFVPFQLSPFSLSFCSIPVVPFSLPYLVHSYSSVHVDVRASAGRLFKPPTHLLPLPSSLPFHSGVDAEESGRSANSSSSSIIFQVFVPGLLLQLVRRSANSINHPIPFSFDFHSSVVNVCGVGLFSHRP